MNNNIDIVFTSFGAYSKIIENYFSSLKTTYPDIKRIHGFKNKERILNLTSKIVDTNHFVLIDVHSLKLFSFDLNTLLENETNQAGVELHNTKDYPQDLLETPLFNEIHAESLEILHLTYKEFDVESRFVRLLKRYPKIKRLHGVKGITRAFKFSSYLIDSKYYVLVDGDSEVLESFDLRQVFLPQEENTIMLYMAQNPVNDLVYGYGGVKVCPTENFRLIKEDRLDPIASGGIKKMKGVHTIASITKFNTSPFNSWKAGFREGVMLSVQSDPEVRMENKKVREKLNIWKTKGEDREFGIWCIRGAIDGEKYAKSNVDSFDKLLKINDPVWLSLIFNEKYGKK